ncbi:MAG: NAD-dependent epimerase/dehydratase family protein [Bacteroidota bacterium]
MDSQLHVIFGTGPVGRAVMEVLVTKGYRVRMVNRLGRADVPSGVAVVAANLLNGTGVNEAAAGASVVYQCANPAYDKWPEQFPGLQRSVLNAAAGAKAKLVIADNLYMYGDTDGAPLTEDLPYNAKTRKGTVRAKMALDALQAHRDGRLKVVIARGSDFFGPHVFASAMGERQFGFAVSGKKASLIGNIDVPHTFTYIKDFGAALVTLAEHDDVFGQVWHVPSAPAVSQREFILKIFQELKMKPEYNSMGKLMLMMGGLFIPAARESVEMLYEFEKPFVMDSTKFEKRFGVTAVSTDNAVRETVQWYRHHTK